MKSISASLAAALLAAACSYAPKVSDDAPRASDVVQLRWIAKGADRVEVLTSLPPACETAPPDSATAEKRRLGKIAFESPALLGGAAARMGLACSSCHLNGRGNPDFFLEGLSGKPGTADVTSSVLSKVRGNQDFDPRPIPDIALRDGKQIKDRTGLEFSAKVHGLVEEEFDGQQAPAQVFDAVMAYLDGLDPSACVSQARVPLGVERDIDAVSAAFRAGSGAELDRASQVFFMRAARFRLERIHERFAAPGQAALRERLVRLSRSLGDAAERIRAGDNPVAEDFIQPEWAEWRAALKAEEPRSLYNPDVLRAMLAAEEAKKP